MHVFGHTLRLVLLVTLAMGAVLGTISAPPAAADPPPESIDLPSDWAYRGSGVITTRTDRNVDLLRYQVLYNVLPSTLVEFRLEDFNRCHWWKEIVIEPFVRRAQTLRTDAAAGIFTDTGFLLADEVLGGKLKFWKAGIFGFGRFVMEARTDTLPPGSRAVFTWLRDRPDC
jgi:hypothetical protein